jgi:hypothetical protein
MAVGINTHILFILFFLISFFGGIIFALLDPDPDRKHWFYFTAASSPDLDNLAVLVGEPAGRHEDGGGDVRVGGPDVVQHRLPGQRVQPLLLCDHLLVVLLAVGGGQVHHLQQSFTPQHPN